MYLPKFSGSDHSVHDDSLNLADLNTSIFPSPTCPSELKYNVIPSSLSHGVLSPKGVFIVVPRFIGLPHDEPSLNEI